MKNTSAKTSVKAGKISQSYWPERDYATCGLKRIMTVSAVVAFPTHTVGPELAGNKPYFVLFDKLVNEFKNKLLE